MLDTLSVVVRLIVALLVILPLIYLSLKFGGNKLQNVQNGTYMKVLEKLSVSKENSLLIIKIGDQGYIFASTGDKMEIIKELTLEQILEIQESKKITQYKDVNEFLQDFKNRIKLQDKNNIIKSIKNKLRIKKED